MTDFRFTYPSRCEMADRVLDDLINVLAGFSVEADLVRALSLTVSEAFTNAVIHGNHEQPDKDVQISLHVMDSKVVADIVDHGRGGVERINARKPSTSMDEGGRGVDLIRYYADASRFAETSDGGLKVSIVFHRNRQNTTRNVS